MDIRTLTSFEDVLNSELESIFGGNEPIKVECKGDGIVEVPTNPEKATMMQGLIIGVRRFNHCRTLKKNKYEIFQI